MVQSIAVFLQPPSPTLNASVYTLPSVKTLFPVNMRENGALERESNSEHSNQQQLPSIRLTKDGSNNQQKGRHVKKLNTIEPRPDSLSISTSPYQQSPIMSTSPCSSTTSSRLGSPLISPIQDGPFLLPPPDSFSRRCRSVSNASDASSPLNSPSISFCFRSLSEPPTLNLPPSSTVDDEEKTEERACHPVFGPKRKRGRPPNASKPDTTQTDSTWTFVKPTVWDVQSSSPSSPRHLKHTPQLYTENKNMSEGINTFTTTNMNMALSIPKKKRGRKPKKQMAGNSCFIWKDLTAPRGANKKTADKKKEDIRTLLPASVKQEPYDGLTAIKFDI